mmetsp:Transcript_5188/g.4765  ORF Transcript_5188/g.4765 Transcript_5188/m.4765 type:complete len:181 (+) Transcript_5188:1836-2378(+)
MRKQREIAASYGFYNKGINERAFIEDIIQSKMEFRGMDKQIKELKFKLTKKGSSFPELDLEGSSKINNKRKLLESASQKTFRLTSPISAINVMETPVALRTDIITNKLNDLNEKHPPRRNIRSLIGSKQKQHELMLKRVKSQNEWRSSVKEMINKVDYNSFKNTLSKGQMKIVEDMLGEK